MLIDAQNRFSNQQAITTDADSENVIDLGVARDIGIGEQLYVLVQVTETFADSGSNSTVTVSLQTDDNAAMSSEAIVAPLVVIPALAAANTQYFIPVPPAILQNYQRYLGLKYALTNGDLSAGKITAALVTGISKNPFYASGITIA